MCEKSNGPNDRTAILILGMQGSGTSAVTRCLNLLGAALPERLMQSSLADPIDNFEPREIVKIHDRLLADVGISRSDWDAFPQEWYESNSKEAFLKELTEAIDTDYGKKNVVLIKDSQILRFIPLWRELLERLSMSAVSVIPYRNPIEVTLSLKRHDKISIEHGMLLWLRHALDSEYHSRGLKRHFISYETLLQNKQRSVYRLIEALPIRWSQKRAKVFDEINEFLCSKCHDQDSPAENLRFDTESPKEVRDVYNAYEQLSVNAYDTTAMKQLDDLRADFEQASGLLSGTFRHLRQRFEADHISFVAHGERVETLVEEVTRQNKHLAANRERADELAKQVAQQNERLAADRERADEMSAELARQNEHIYLLKQALVTAQGLLNQISPELAKLRETIYFQNKTLQVLHHGLSDTLGELRIIQRVKEDAKRTRIWRIRSKKAWGFQHDRVLRSGLFDPTWYRKTYKIDEEADPLNHFVQIGSQRGHSPSPLFDAEWYLEANPDIADQGVEPLTHYLTFGRAEGRSPIRQS